MEDFDYLGEGEVYLDGACQSLRPRPVIDALGRVPVPQTSMTFDKTEMFRDILVYAFCVEPSLREYVRKIRQELDARGIVFDRKPFRPHVTLVRRTVFSDGKPDTSALEALPDTLDIPVRRVCLMRTDFVNGRPQYTCMRSFS